MHVPGPWVPISSVGRGSRSSEAAQVTAVQAACTARSAENDSVEQGVGHRWSDLRFCLWAFYSDVLANFQLP